LRRPHRHRQRKRRNVMTAKSPTDTARSSAASPPADETASDETLIEAFHPIDRGQSAIPRGRAFGQGVRHRGPAARNPPPAAYLTKLWRWSPMPKSSASPDLTRGCVRPGKPRPTAPGRAARGILTVGNGPKVPFRHGTRPNARRTGLGGFHPVGPPLTSTRNSRAATATVWRGMRTAWGWSPTGCHSHGARSFGAESRKQRRGNSYTEVPDPLP
jgi:hypothetical protein